MSSQMLYALKLDLENSDFAKYNKVLERLEQTNHRLPPYVTDGRNLLIHGNVQDKTGLAALCDEIGIPHVYMLQPNGDAFLCHSESGDVELLGKWTDDVHEILYETQTSAVDYIELGSSLVIILN